MIPLATNRPRPRPIRAPFTAPRPDLADAAMAAFDKALGQGCQRWHATARMAPLERVRVLPMSIGELLAYAFAVAVVVWFVTVAGRVWVAGGGGRW
jgi:hypothetical protein